MLILYKLNLKVFKLLIIFIFIPGCKKKGFEKKSPKDYSATELLWYESLRMPNDEGMVCKSENCVRIRWQIIYSTCYVC